MGQVDGAFESGHLDVDPVLFIGRIGVGSDEGVLRTFEAVAIKGVYFHIPFFGQVNAEIAARFGQITRLTVA